MIPINVLARRFREALELYDGSSGPRMRGLRRELDELTDQILQARILDGIDPLPVRADISHVERDLP